MIGYHFPGQTFETLIAHPYWKWLDEAGPWSADQQPDGLFITWADDRLERFEKGLVEVKEESYTFYHRPNLKPFDQLLKRAASWRLNTARHGAINIEPARFLPRELMFSLSGAKQVAPQTSEYGLAAGKIQLKIVNKEPITDAEKSELVILALMFSYRVTPDLISAYRFGFNLHDMDVMLPILLGDTDDPK